MSGATSRLAARWLVWLTLASGDADATELELPPLRAWIPPDAAEGEVLVTAEELTSRAEVPGGPTEPFLRVRMVVWNRDGSTTWTIDTRAQRLVIGDAGPRVPAFANTAPGSVEVEVPPRLSRSIDLFFAIPATAIDAVRRGAFAIAWSVRVSADRLIEEETLVVPSDDPARAPLQSGSGRDSISVHGARAGPRWSAGAGAGP
jgi:hypothetical protein